MAVAGGAEDECGETEEIGSQTLREQLEKVGHWGKLMPTEESRKEYELERCYLLTKKKVIIGRIPCDKGVDVSIPISQLSAQHCTLELDDSTLDETGTSVVKLTDHSRNGIWVNKAHMKHATKIIFHCDELMFIPNSPRKGRVKLAFQLVIELELHKRLLHAYGFDVDDANSFGSSSSANGRSRSIVDSSGDLLTHGLFQKYAFLKTLGNGAFAQVKLFKSRSKEGTLCAVKEIDSKSWRKLQRSTKRNIGLLDEVRLMAQTQHPHIVAVHEWFTEGYINDGDDCQSDDAPNHSKKAQSKKSLSSSSSEKASGKVYVVMDFLSGGDMLDYIQQNGAYKDRLCKRVFLQLVSAIDYLHCLNIAHRDLKPDNILLADKKSSLVKIADFGISRETTDSQICQTIIGTPLYQAPEVSLYRSLRENSKGYNAKMADYWSLGIILFVMATAAPPAEQPKDVAPAVRDKRLNWWDDQDPIDERCKSLCYSMLNLKARKRAKAEEIYEHPWFDDVRGYVECIKEQNRIAKERTTQAGVKCADHEDDCEDENENDCDTKVDVADHCDDCGGISQSRTVDPPNSYEGQGPTQEKDSMLVDHHPRPDVGGLPVNQDRDGDLQMDDHQQLCSKLDKSRSTVDESKSESTESNPHSTAFVHSADQTGVTMQIKEIRISDDDETMESSVSAPERRKKIKKRTLNEMAGKSAGFSMKGDNDDVSGLDDNTPAFKRSKT